MHETRQGQLGRVAGIVATALAVATALTGCGDDGSPSLGDLPPGDDGAGDADGSETDLASGADTGGDVDDTNFVVVIDGMEYAVDTDRGGYCEIEGETDTGGNISVGGFDDLSGTRVELSLRYQTGDTTPSGEDEYFGSLSVASSSVGWSTSSTEPWPFPIADPVSATLSMMDDDGQAVDVIFEVDCGSGDVVAPADDGSNSGDDGGDSAAAGGITQAECDVLWDLFHGVGGAQLAPAEMRELLDSLPARGPADKTEDLQALADVWRPALQMLEDLGVENADDVANLSADDLQRVEEAAAPFNAADFADARVRIDAFVGGGCQGG